jgi:hypothetical protein
MRNALAAINSRMVGNPEVMSIAKWYLRSTSGCVVIKEPVPGAAACRGFSSLREASDWSRPHRFSWISCIVDFLSHVVLNRLFAWKARLLDSKRQLVSSPRNRAGTLLKTSRTEAILIFLKLFVRTQRDRVSRGEREAQSDSRRAP